MRKTPKIAVETPLKGGDLVEDLGFDVGVTSQWN
jgi:hypothetical protein